LPIDASEIIGAKFIFGDEFHIIIGTITSLAYAPEQGLSLQVSSSYFRGDEIKCLHWNNHGWRVKRPADKIEATGPAGNLEIV
jgi:hypothetical protein